MHACVDVSTECKGKEPFGANKMTINFSLKNNICVFLRWQTLMSSTYLFILHSGQWGLFYFNLSLLKHTQLEPSDLICC